MDERRRAEIQVCVCVCQGVIGEKMKGEMVKKMSEE